MCVCVCVCVCVCANLLQFSFFCVSMRAYVCMYLFVKAMQSIARFLFIINMQSALGIKSNYFSITESISNQLTPWYT